MTCWQSWSLTPDARLRTVDKLQHHAGAGASGIHAILGGEYVHHHSIHRGRRALIALLAAGLIATGPVLTATASATSHAQSSTFKCTAPPVVTVGFAGTPGSDLIQDLPLYAYGAQLEKVCHTTLDIEYIALSATAALLGGSIMYASGSTYNQIKAYGQGTQTQEVQLWQQVQGGSTVYVASTKYKGLGVGINAIPKFANVTWGVPFLTGANAIYYDLILKKAGLNPASVNFNIVGGDGSVALANNQVQLLQYYEVWNSSGLQAYRLAGFIPSGALDTMRSTINEYPSLTQEMVNVQVETMKLMRKDINNPAAIYALFPAAAQVLIPYSQFLGTWSTWRADYVPLTGLLTQKDMQRAANLGYDYAFVPTPVTMPKDQIDTTFLDKAYKMYGLKPPTTEIDPAYEYLMSNSNAEIAVNPIK